MMGGGDGAGTEEGCVPGCSATGSGCLTSAYATCVTRLCAGADKC